MGEATAGEAELADVVLFHSAYGLRPGVRKWAEKLRDAVGIPELMRRAHTAVADLPEHLVYAGFSMGASAAEHLAVTRLGAAGAILMHGAIPLALAGADSWPNGVDVQIHYAEDDPLVDAAVVAAVAAAARAAGASAEVRTYRGGGHLFADEGLPEYDADAAAQMLQASLAFLDRR